MNEQTAFDPIELSLYISRRLQTDNDWLVDKLAQVEKQRVAEEEMLTYRLQQEAQNTINVKCDIMDHKMELIH